MKSFTEKRYRDASNFINYPLNLDGNAFKTIVIDKEANEMLILKSQKVIKGKPCNDQISEYLTCNILKICGYNAQKTQLMYYNGELVVAITIKDEIIQLKQVKSYFEDSSKVMYDLDYIYNIAETIKPKINMDRFREHIRELVLVSYVFCNVDLHPGNIGFVDKNGEYFPSEIYDMGGSLLSIHAKSLSKLLEMEKELETTVKVSRKNYKALEYITSEELKGINQKLVENKEEILELINTLPENFIVYGRTCYEIILKRSSPKEENTLNWS